MSDKLDIQLYICQVCNEGAVFNANEKQTMACVGCGDVRISRFRLAGVTDVTDGRAIANEPVEPRHFIGDEPGAIIPLPPKPTWSQSSKHGWLNPS